MAWRHIAKEDNRSRWDRAARRLILPVSVTVAVAIICLVVAVVASARRADEISLGREKQLISEAIAARAVLLLREVESVAASKGAAEAIREHYDPQWVQDRIGGRLESVFDNDLVAVIDDSDQIKYARALNDGSVDVSTVKAELAAIVDRLHGKLGEASAPVVPVVDAQDPLKPGRSTAVIENFGGQPALVAAVSVGSDSDLAAGNAAAPIVIAVRYVDDRLLREIGGQLGLPSLRRAGNLTPAPDQHVVVADAQNRAIVLLTWQSQRPGAEIASRVIPFVAAAIIGFIALGGLVIRHMRRTAQAVAEGETRLRHLALHDPVCGLPNRIYFGERLESMIGEVRRGSSSAAVFYIDLDHFKDVNDTLGHHIGDDLILNVTQRLSGIARGDDLVARLGGDEFAVITTCASDSYSLQSIAGRIIAAVCAPYMINGHNIVIGASVGIAVIDRRAGDAADILRYADMALYRAKNEGRNRACIYDAAMDADLSQRKLLEGDLLQAIRNDGLAAVYQPIVNAAGDTMIGVEALARWTHPTAGEIPPSVFIPIAEHSGLIVELGEWMLRRACLDGHNWPGLTVSVNVSPLQFRRSDFVDVIERILKETEFDPERLELELTESTLLGNLETAELSMLRLKAIGVRFALDDFGTGYSSLLYLRRFPFDKLKIDSSFVHSIETAPDAAAIVHAVVSLGRGLGMRVTAEGVENAEQHLFLRAAGVHSMQGFRFGKPGPAQDVTARLKSPDAYRVGNPDREIALAS